MVILDGIVEWIAQQLMNILNLITTSEVKLTDTTSYKGLIYSSCDIH